MFSLCHVDFVDLSAGEASLSYLAAATELLVQSSRHVLNNLDHFKIICMKMTSSSLAQLVFVSTCTLYGEFFVLCQENLL